MLFASRLHRRVGTSIRAGHNATGLLAYGGRAETLLRTCTRSRRASRTSAAADMATGGGKDVDIVRRIGKNIVQNVKTKENVPLESLWEDAVRISTLRPTLDANGVKLVGVGLEQLGAEEFVKQRFLDGEVYVDEKKKTYEDLGYKRFNFLNIWKALLSAISRKALSDARAENISGNLSGDGLQNGGLLIVTKGGEQVLLNHREETPGDHVANAVILETLGLKQENARKSEGTVEPQECTTTCVDDPTPASEVPEQECTTTCAIESKK